MNVIATDIPEVLIVEPTVYEDVRGYFYESFNQQAFNLATGTNHQFVQDNHSRSDHGVLRGLHYQVKRPQGKLVRVVSGSVFDVAVDLRVSSTTFGRWVGVELTAENRKQFWIPPGFAHGFLVLSSSAEFLYKTTDYYEPKQERCILWDDPEIAIGWPTGEKRLFTPSLSLKDKQGRRLSDISVLNELSEQVNLCL